ncbi:MAG: excinuclease ATPase subunit [Gammaproteobacteria bacterium]|nr:excinuclease ATPase subunit [Gammaproteobacteria bacterium]MDH3372023.1 excinuclease ATPase subunit [Gammaproteobacteria bacterium]MDH3410208.1 excinuclease ATPase subunit [Gammaproteobacteria bacterium]MDH3551607.1 excinuclease ATPase subunit [Gammaproteobacteria bacterium]
MKQFAHLLLISTLLFSYSVGNARNTIHRYSIEEALTVGEERSRIDSSIRLFFGDQKHPAVKRKLGTYTANKKTNAVNKSDREACNWAFLSAMVSLQSRATREGGNAVVNIRSYYYKNKFSSATEFECGAGAVVAGVTMIGEVVELAE